MKAKPIAQGELRSTAPVEVLAAIRSAETIRECDLRAALEARGQRLRQDDIHTLIAAGLVARRDGHLVALRLWGQDRSPQEAMTRRGYSDAEILERAQLWAKLTGHAPTKLEWNLSRLRRAVEDAPEPKPSERWALHLHEVARWPSDPTVRYHFGNFTKMIMAAGLTPRLPHRRRGGRPESDPATEAARQVYQRLVVHRDEAREQLLEAELQQLLAETSQGRRGEKAAAHRS
jgi:hypothetical protein